MGKDSTTPAEIFTQEKNKEIYDMYALVMNTLQYYTIDEIKELRTIIPILYEQKQRYAQNSKEKGNNNEKYVLGLLGNQTTLSDQKIKNTDPYQLLTDYASFFSIFKTTEANISIIDLTVLKKFANNSETEISNDQSYLNGKDMKFNFDKAISAMETNNDLADLETVFENLPEK